MGLWLIIVGAQVCGLLSLAVTDARRRTPESTRVMRRILARQRVWERQTRGW
jgi:hypothetical protein